MIEAPWTAVHNTPNKSLRRVVPRKGVVLHGAAMTSLAGLRRLAMGAKQVSATAICKDDALELLMGDAYRAWSLADAWGDSTFRSIECANESVDGWTFSDASIWSMARAVAYWAQEDGFYPQRAGGDRREWTVIGHREFHEIYGGSYPTVCPQSMDMDLVTRRAQGLLLGSSLAGGGDPTVPDLSRKKDTMQLAYIPKGAANGKDALFLLFGERFYLEFVGQKAADAFNTQIGGNTAPASRSFFDAVARAQGLTQKVEIVNLDEGS